VNDEPVVWEKAVRRASCGFSMVVTMPGHACRSKLLIFGISCKNCSDSFLDATSWSS
jgi:hypothetical protein